MTVSLTSSTLPPRSALPAQPVRRLLIVDLGYRTAVHRDLKIFAPESSDRVHWHFQIPVLSFLVHEQVVRNHFARRPQHLAVVRDDRCPDRNVARTIRS